MATTIRYQDSNLDTFADLSVGAETIALSLYRWDESTSDYETVIDQRYSGYTIDEVIETALHESGITPIPILRRVS